MLNKARGVIDVYSINHSSAPEGTNISQTGWYVMKDGSVVDYATYSANTANALTTDFAVSGRIDINKIVSNPHAQFRFNSSKRFLLWDSNSDGFIGIGYTDGVGVHVSEVKNSNPFTWQFEDKLSLRWTVIVKGTDAYFYINDCLVKHFADVSAQGFNLGALTSDVEFYNISLVTGAANASEFSAILTAKGIS